MRVLVIGASGAVGRQLVPQLTAAGHDVTATTTSGSAPAGQNAAVIQLDLLDRAAVDAAIRTVRPDAIVHQATSLKAVSNNLRRFDAIFSQTNRLRTIGTASLLAAAAANGSPQVIVQSFCGWPWAPIGGPVKTETDPLDDHPPSPFQNTIKALIDMEAMIGDYPNGVALRYGGLYGPFTSLSAGGPQITAVQARRFPLVGNAAGVWSFTHVSDAAAAAVAALARGRGIYNIVDDDPAPVHEWLPHLAEAAGAKPPRHVPAWLARIIAGDAAVHLMTRVRGSSNAKAKREIGWSPRVSSWRQGFDDDLAELRTPGSKAPHPPAP